MLKRLLNFGIIVHKSLWIPGNQAAGPVQKPPSADGTGHPDQLIPGAEEIISHGNVRSSVSTDCPGAAKPKRGHPKGNIEKGEQVH